MIPERPPVAKALNQNGSDGEKRKLGERPGLDMEYGEKIKIF